MFVILYRNVSTIAVTKASVNVDAWQCPAWWPPVAAIANDTDLLTPVLWTMAGGWVRTPVLFLAVCGPKYINLRLWLCGSVHSLQCRFSIDDVLLPSGEICDQVKLSEIAPKFLGRQILGGRGSPNFWRNFINLVAIEHVTKFGDDRPSELGD